MGKRDGSVMAPENNISYIFIPFRYEGQDSRSLPEVLKSSGDWELVDDEIEYMLKYVADRIEGKDSGKSSDSGYRVYSCTILIRLCLSWHLDCILNREQTGSRDLCRRR